MRHPIAAYPAVALAAWTATATPATRDAAARRAGEDLLATSIAAYTKLTSYADSGTGTYDSGGTLDVGHFRTYFRKPNNFYFEWSRRVSIAKNSPPDSLPMPGKQRVFWMRNGELETYDKEAGLHKTYPAASSNQPAALAGAKAGTMETITLIPSLLFPKASLVGPLQEIAEISLAGTEEVAGHPCHKLVGIARSVYPSGAITNVRPIAVWIDTETLLIRKVFTDTPKGTASNVIARITYVVNPTLNSTLEDARFQFTVPETQP
jgi:outer membrane lipoprotein-sorting protein